MITIYRLIDPRTGAVRYISLTNPAGQEWGEFTAGGLHAALRGQ